VVAKRECLPLRTGIAVGGGGVDERVFVVGSGQLLRGLRFGHEHRQPGLLGGGLPAAFVDTSDIWMHGKSARAAVALSGPVVNIVLSGIASIAMNFVIDKTLQIALF